MHLRKSEFLLLTTAVLTSITVASSPSSATPWMRLDADIDIAQRDVDHKVVDEPVHSVVKGDIWADGTQIQENAAFLENAQHDSIDVDAKIKNDIAKRAEVSATTIEYSTKTWTTDVTNPTGRLKEKLSSNQQVKAKVNANPQVQQVSELLASAHSAPAAKQSSSQQIKSGTAAQTTRTRAIIDGDATVKTETKTIVSEYSVARSEKPTAKVNTRSRDLLADKPKNPSMPNKTRPTSLEQSLSTATANAFLPQSLLPSSQLSPFSDTIAKASVPNSSAPQSSRPTNTSIDTNTRHAKRAPSGFGYVYDSTTVLVTPPHTTGHYASASTMKLRFGAVSLVPTTRKSNSHV